jgi:hypothetical protein
MSQVITSEIAVNVLIVLMEWILRIVVMWWISSVPEIVFGAILLVIQRLNHALWAVW